MRNVIISIGNKEIRCANAGKLCLDDAKDTAHAVWIAKKIFKEQHGKDMIFHIHIDGEPVDKEDPMYYPENDFEYGINLNMTAVDAKTLRRVNSHLFITQLDDADLKELNVMEEK